MVNCPTRRPPLIYAPPVPAHAPNFQYNTRTPFPEHKKPRTRAGGRCTPKYTQEPMNPRIISHVHFKMIKSSPLITPQYRSEGRRQGSNGVFWGLYDITYTLSACIFTLL